MSETKIRVNGSKEAIVVKEIDYNDCSNYEEQLMIALNDEFDHKDYKIYSSNEYIILIPTDDKLKVQFIYFLNGFTSGYEARK